jgi:UDP-N-acetylglucosamine enolpyruvyl transferase
MDRIRIVGGGPLEGAVRIAGAKNAALPAIAAAILTDEPLNLTSVPDVRDVTTMLRVLERLGAEWDAPSHGRREIALKDVTNDEALFHARGTVVSRRGALTPVDVETRPYPGFPTDMQAQWMALMTQSEGTATINETIFEGRFLHALELQRMGADLAIDGHRVVSHGPARLSGAEVTASDLRASACLVLAGLVARGETTIHRVYHLDRGYERMEEKLRLRPLGADIERIS